MNKDVKKLTLSDIWPLCKGNDKKSGQHRRFFARSDFRFFMFLYMAHWLEFKPGEYQLKSYSRAFDQYVLEIWPRGFGKSVTWSVCYPLWVLLCNPFNLTDYEKENIYLVSCAQQLAEDWISVHKQELTQNELILRDYAPAEGSTWRSDRIDVKVKGAGGMITGKGMGSKIRGRRPTEVVIDDLEDRAESKSADHRGKVVAYFYQDLLGVEKLKGKTKTRFKMVGTIVHPQALLLSLYNNDAIFKIKSLYGVYKEDGSPLWPDYTDEAALRALYDRITSNPLLGTAAWQSEYLNDPIITENPIFVKQQIKEYDSESDEFKLVKSDGLHTVIALDPAISRRDNADYTAIVTIGATKEAEPRYYVRSGGAVRGRWPLNHTVTELARIHEKMGAHKIVIEAVAYQQAVADEYLRYAEENRFYADVRAIKPDKDKERRAHAIVPLLQRGRVFFDLNDPVIMALVSEMMLFPTGMHDDLVDAFVYALMELKEWSARESLSQNCPYIVLPKGCKRNELTGIVA